MSAGKSKRRSSRAGTLDLRALAPWLILGSLVLIAVLWGVLRGPKGGDSPIEARLMELAAKRGVDAESIAADDPIRKVDGVFVRTWKLSFPSREARDGFIGDLELEGAARHATLVVPEDLAAPELAARLDFGLEVFDLRLQLAERRAEAPTEVPEPTPRPTATPRPQPAPDARGRLAILVDDAGQNFELVDAVTALADEVGVAVLPFLPKSTETATAVHKAGHEVWLHLPMEPMNGSADPGPGAVLVSMDTASIRTAVHSALNSIPFAVGVNNHMGSRATADLKTMTWVMQELSARGMAFIDSRTTVKTVAEEAARAQGVPVARRHVFLDNRRDAAAIRTQLDEAVYRCRLDGEAIAIGHLDAVTLQVLADELPGIAGRGADLVKPSELTR
jgi:polysaccharide deacetylase 2 family uncharacterized protein YibQ